MIVFHLPAAGSSHDRTIDYFSQAVRSSRELTGLRKVTLDLSDTGDEGRLLLERIGSEVAYSGLELCAVVWAFQVEAWGPAAFTNCREVALCVDTRQYPALRLPAGFHTAVEGLQAESRVVGYQVLLNGELINRLKLPRLRKWLDRADFVTLVPPRSLPVDFDRSQLVSFFERLTPLWEHADRFFHLQVDRGIKPAFFPWNLLSVTCPAADLALHLEPDGHLFMCAQSQPFACLTAASGLAEAVEEHLLREGAGAGLCEGLAF